MPSKSIEQYIKEANIRLKIAESALRISKSGKRIYLRGTLPPKPDSDKSVPYQQTIALPNNYANVACIKSAEKECLYIDGLLARREFNWVEYQKRGKRPEKVGGWIECFRSDYFAKRAHKDQNKVETTWNTHYWYALKRLEPEETLTPELLYDEIHKTQPDTKTRQRLCDVFKQFAKFCGFEIDIKELRGSYSTGAINPRTLPDDQTIIEFREYFENPSWKWSYGVIAAYGLRNHEVFYVDPDSLKTKPGILLVQEGAKVHEHEVWPCYPEWWEEWSLWNVSMPSCSGKNSDLGHRVSTAFRRAKDRYFNSAAFLNLVSEQQEEKRSKIAKVTPYNLRHAWAVRTILMGWPDSLAAAQMDHSLAIHNKTYQRWLSREHHQQVFNILVNRPDRPKPPKSSN